MAIILAAGNIMDTAMSLCMPALFILATCTFTTLPIGWASTGWHITLSWRVLDTRPASICLMNAKAPCLPRAGKLRVSRQKWYAGETISVGIGQGAVTVSPLQLAAAVGGLAVGGNWYQPHLTRVDTPKLLRAGHLNPQNVQDVISGMYGVVNEGGTGRFAALPGIKVCGKTGSAQILSEAAQKGNVANNLKDNGWFVGFAPQEAPEIVVVALFENAVHGDKAAWIVRDVLKAYFDKKARQTSTNRNAGLFEPAIFAEPARLLALAATPASQAGNE